MDFDYSYLLTAQNFSSEMKKQVFLESRWRACGINGT